MQAIKCVEYGSAEVLQFVEVETPVPRRREVLVRIHAATVSAEDPKMRAFDHPLFLRLPVALLFGYPRPRRGIWGMEFAGEVAGVGEGVTRFALGDRVFGYTGVGLGAHAEYRCLPESGILAKIPSGMTYAEAAAVPNGGLTALVYLRNMASLRSGEKILVYGASGAVGIAAVQLAKAFGAHVTGVCSTRNVSLVQSLGADDVIDYTRQDFREGSERYDVVFDTVGGTSMKDVKASLTHRGRYLVTVFSFRDCLRMLWTSLAGGQKMIGGASNFYWRPQDLELLCELFSERRWTSVIDRIYPWTEVADAHRYVETGRKRGNVVLLVGSTGAEERVISPGGRELEDGRSELLAQELVSAQEGGRPGVEAKEVRQIGEDVGFDRPGE
jgi:NADPH:quinone reductase-like Zn-dependent oxidoreductase